MTFLLSDLENSLKLIALESTPWQFSLMDPKPPNLSGRTFYSSSMEGLGLCDPMKPAVLGTAVSHPPPQQPPPEPKQGSWPALLLQEATAQSQLSGLGCWHLPSSPQSFHTGSQPRILMKGEGRGLAAWVHPDQCRPAQKQPTICLCDLSIFHSSRCDSSRDRQTAQKNYSIQFHCFLLIMTYCSLMALLLLCHMLSFFLWHGSTHILYITYTIWKVAHSCPSLQKWVNVGEMSVQRDT
jgi:hypothetical protein